jgi:hypothetical protein
MRYSRRTPPSTRHWCLPHVSLPLRGGPGSTNALQSLHPATPAPSLRDTVDGVGLEVLHRGDAARTYPVVRDHGTETKVLECFAYYHPTVPLPCPSLQLGQMGCGSYGGEGVQEGGVADEGTVLRFVEGGSGGEVLPGLAPLDGEHCRVATAPCICLRAADMT